jgi:hypothetical protein
MNKRILTLVIGVLAMTTLGQARVSGDADLAIQYTSTGWVEDAESRTWSYSSADAPTYVFSVNDDMTTILSAGMRVRFKQSAGTYKYAIITAVGSYSGGATLITAYFGTDYDLDNEEVTNMAYSAGKSPFGFPMNPDKWTVETSDFSNNDLSSFNTNEYVNLGSKSITVPVGIWNMYAMARIHLSMTTSPSSTINFVWLLATDSTTTGSTPTGAVSASKAGFQNIVVAAPSSQLAITGSASTQFVLDLSTETIYYFMVNPQFNGTPTTKLLQMRDFVIRAVCAYL